MRIKAVTSLPHLFFLFNTILWLLYVGSVIHPVTYSLWKAKISGRDEKMDKRSALRVGGMSGLADCLM